MSGLLIHPTIQRLTLYVQEELHERQRRRVASHLAHCSACRQRLRSLRELDARLTSLTTPAASKDLFPRILASRAAGDRVILPPADATPVQRVLSRGPAIGVAAAAVLAIATMLSVRTPHHSGGFFQGLVFSPTTALAQEPTDTLGRARYPLLGRVTVGHLKPGIWEYAWRMVVDKTVVTPQGSSRFSIIAATLGDTPTWVFVNQIKGKYARDTAYDSVLVEREDLRLIRHRWAYVLRGPMVADYSKWAAPQFLSWQQADFRWLGSTFRALFQLQPLQRLWRGSFYIRWTSPTEPHRQFWVPVDLHVDREERAQVPGGSFDTWRVAIEGQKDRMYVWVAKESGVVVKVNLPLRGDDDIVYEQILVTHSPADSTIR